LNDSLEEDADSPMKGLLEEGLDAASKIIND